MHRSGLVSRARGSLRDPATASAYRQMILAPGGSASMNDVARDFVGRDGSVDAFRSELGRGER